MNALATIPTNNVEIYRASTDAAELCKGIVVASAMQIGGRKYVKVEGWQAIAIAHGCTGSARDVEEVEGGVRAIGEVRRMCDGAVIATAEGFVGRDEPTWYGGGNKPKRADYAIRAMAQTRAISRACRSAFAHVVVMMNAGLSTTPYEEVPEGGFDGEDAPAPRKAKRAADDVTTHVAYGPATSTINECKSLDALESWEQTNAGIMGRLKQDRPDVHAAIIEHFNRHRGALRAIDATFGDAADEAGAALADEAA